MSGNVPLSSRASSKMDNEETLAAQLFENFTGHEAEYVQLIDVDTPRAGMIIGTLDGVLYTAVRDGEEESYIHEFSGDSKPLLVAGSDGETLFIVGGEYEFTERGIVDR